MNQKAEQVIHKASPEHIDVRAVITVTARLAQLLAEEVDLLTGMKVSKIEHLQKEKIYLTNALEAQKKLIDKHPHVLDTIPSQDRYDLQQIVDVFNDILAENHRKLLLAKEVNHQIVQAITSVVKEHTQSKVYDDSGTTGMAPFESLSVTLNQTV
jgi:flagellar biosynthesis/type III secretory pathway chaperone